MTDNFNNADDRFGSAGIASTEKIRRAGHFKKTDTGIFFGFDGNRPLFYDGAGGAIITAAARSGKLRDILAYNLCSGILAAETLVILDLKGEEACVSANQTPDQKYCLYWNPVSLHGMPQDRLNPLDYIRSDSPSLVSDVKVFCENIIPESGSTNSQYFERRAQEFLEAIILTLVRLKGTLTYPDLYHVINLIPGNSEAWLDFGFEMTQAGFDISKRVEEEIGNSRKETGNGFQGILGEIFKAFACLSDPVLMASVSPPFTMSMADLCNPERKYQFYLMPPAEFVGSWSPVIKSIFVAGMIYKARSPQSPRQTWIIDEAAQLKNFPLIAQLYSYGAGIGIRPLTVWQSTKQMNAIGRDSETIITASSALRIYFAVRDLNSATSISTMMGAQTLEFDDEFKQANARHAKQQALQAMLNGSDPISAGLNYAHHKREAETKSKQHRLLRTPAEILSTPPDRLYAFVDGLEKPIYATRKPYYEQRFMAGRYLNNPYYPPGDRVRVKTRMGNRTKKIITEPVPARYADYPQYRGSTWRRVDR